MSRSKTPDGDVTMTEPQQPAGPLGVQSNDPFGLDAERTALVLRLRTYAAEHSICGEAANEIESMEKMLKRMRDWARLSERQWDWYQAAYRQLVKDLLHNNDHPDGPKRQIDLNAAMAKFFGPDPEDGDLSRIT